MRWLRAWAGPAIIGVSAWCAAGTMAVVGPDQATPRAAVPATVWIFVLATVVAACLPTLRRRPWTALPALLATVSWWPVPLPPILLVFTGPLAWLPVIASLTVAVGVTPIAALGRAIGATRPSRAPWLAAFATLVMVIATAWSAAPQSPGGDEPHYLVITQSLLLDGDLRVLNNYQQKDYASYYGGHLEPHYLVPGKNGQIYSVHAPGLPALVLPGFALFGYRGAEATVLLLAALTGAFVWRIGWWTSRDVHAAWFGWAAITTSTTFLIQGFTIYPDGPAMVAVAAASLLLVRLGDKAGSPSPAGLVASSIPLAILPWLHSRFAVIAVGFGVAVVLRLITDRQRTVGQRLVRVVTFVGVPLVSAVGWFSFFYVIYGTINPAAPYGDTSGMRVQYAPAGALALLFDGQFGLLTYAPVLLASVVGWLRPLDRASRRAGVETLIVLALYVGSAMTYWMWWAGRPAPPARFFAAMLPVLAIPLVSAWMRGDQFRRTAYCALVGVAMALSAVAIGVPRGATAWNDRDAQSRLLLWLGPVVNLRRGWPSFFWTLDPDFLASGLSSEWLFVGRVAVFLAAWMAVWFVVRWFGGRTKTDAVHRRAAAGIWLLGGVLLAVQAGWWANANPGLDAERAQSALLQAARSGRPIVGIYPGHLSRQAEGRGQLLIGTEEPGVIDPPPWFLGSDLPAGDYQVTLRLDHAQVGTLLISAGATPTPRAVQAVPEQTWLLSIRSDHTEVVMTPDETLRRAGGRVFLTAKWGS